MAALVPASIVRSSAGSLTELAVRFTTVSDGDTWASGLGTSAMNHVYQGTGNPSTQASAGGNVANSSGTFTFYPGENSLAGTLFVRGNF